MFGKDLDFSSGKKLINNRGVIVTNGKLHQQIIDMVNE
jgi:adhesin HecA-like repeat protein